MRIGDLVGCNDARTHRGVAVLAFGIDPLAGAPAVPRADIDDHAIAEYIGQRRLAADALGGTADDGVMKLWSAAKKGIHGDKLSRIVGVQLGVV